MIAKAIKGSGFRGAANYDLGKGVVLDTNMAGRNPRELAAEFATMRRLRPNLKKAVLHVSLAAAPGEVITDDQWRAIAARYLKGMGFENNQFVVTKHSDTDHPHIHILVNRVTMDGKVVSDSNDYKRQEALMRQIESEFGLTPVLSSQDAPTKALSKGEIERSIRTGGDPPRLVLQKLIDSAVEGGPGLSEFMDRMRKHGVEVKLNVASTGRVSGVSFSLDGVQFKGSDLGKNYTWASLLKRGLVPTPAPAPEPAPAPAPVKKKPRPEPGDRKGWLDRFRKARKVKARTISRADLDELRRMDPGNYLLSKNYNLRRDGMRNLSVRDEDGREVYRLTRKDDGRWLWVDREGIRGGDNLDLVQEIEGVGFVEAREVLSGGPVPPPLPLPRPTPAPAPIPAPAIPIPEQEDVKSGVDYLVSRGISRETIKLAIDAKALWFDRGGVLFVGYDEDGKVQNISRRAVSPHDHRQKMDYAGSRKVFAPVIPGNPESVWIVEGGVDALALVDLAKRKGVAPPTIIISGGAGVRSFLENPRIKKILSEAKKIAVVCDRETDTETQKKTDADHKKQCDLIHQMTGIVPTPWMTPQGWGKDPADLNCLIKIREEEKKKREEEERKKRIEEEQRIRKMDEQKIRKPKKNKPGFL
ncbi:MAG: relaxase/mobilization nuclease domain-containing protein [Nitrospiraceae bacterium]|nr:relaxase/mobilization nuclease domain-containing protein [Nitrospiraceae bacterium]